VYCLEWLLELLREDYRPLPQAVEVGLRRRMTTNTLMRMVIGLVGKRKQEAELLKEGAGRVRFSSVPELPLINIVAAGVQSCFDKHAHAWVGSV